jgi:putative hydrolase of the HAD superfamily
MAVRNVIFDLGNVLIGYDFERFFRGMGCPPYSHTLQDVEHILLPFDAGRMSRREFIDAMQDFLGTDVSDSEFEHHWCDHFFAMDEMLDVAVELAKTHRVYLLSNTDAIHFPYIRRTFPRIALFDDSLMLSYQLGVNKPHADIYRKALALYDLRPEESVFIDDRQENTAAAALQGWHTIHHRDAFSTIHSLNQLLKIRKL